MKLVGSGGQHVSHYMYDASGAVTTGGTAQLILPKAQARSFLMIENTSAGNLLFEFDGARATATLTSGAVSSTSITNAGFGYVKAPIVRFWGGGGPVGVPAYGGVGMPGEFAPQIPATGIAVLSGATVGSITITNPGVGYLTAPYVQLINSDLDPVGCAVPSATVGLLLAANGSFTFNGTYCPTGTVSVFGASTGQAFVCKYAD